MEILYPTGDKEEKSQANFTCRYIPINLKTQQITDIHCNFCLLCATGHQPCAKWKGRKFYRSKQTKSIQFIQINFLLCLGAGWVFKEWNQFFTRCCPDDGRMRNYLATLSCDNIYTYVCSQLTLVSGNRTIFSIKIIFYLNFEDTMWPDAECCSQLSFDTLISI